MVFTLQVPLGVRSARQQQQTPRLWHNILMYCCGFCLFVFGFLDAPPPPPPALSCSPYPLSARTLLLLKGVPEAGVQPVHRFVQGARSTQRPHVSQRGGTLSPQPFLPYTPPRPFIPSFLPPSLPPYIHPSIILSPPPLCVLIGRRWAEPFHRLLGCLISR